jgi:hypothetical protein
LEVEIAIEKVKRYRSTGTDEILAEVIQAGGNILRSDIHKLSNSVWNKEELPSSGRNLFLYLFIERVIKLAVVIIEG